MRLKRPFDFPGGRFFLRNTLPSSWVDCRISGSFKSDSIYNNKLRQPKPYPPAEPKEPPTAFGPDEPRPKKKKARVYLRDGKERLMQHTVQTSFWSAGGKPISAEEFLNNLFGELPKLFKNDEELRKLWSNPFTIKTLLENLHTAGFPKDDLMILQKLVDMQKSDLYDVLEHLFKGDSIATTREARSKAAEATILPYSMTTKESLSYS